MWYTKLMRFWIAGLSLLAAALACDFPGITSVAELPESDRDALVATRVAATMAAGRGAEVPEGAEPPPASSENPPPQAAPADTTTPTITLTPTVTLTHTPAIPMVSVTMNTNCRFGPGMVYNYLGALLVGETAEIHGVNPNRNFWYIENPDNAGTYCWISAMYAQVTGDTSLVPVLTPQPTPTNTPVALTFTFSPTNGPAGSDVELYLSAAVQVEVYYEGRVLPKRVLAEGRTLRVTIPGDAVSGYFELRWDGQSVRATEQFSVTPTSATLTLYNNSGKTVWYVYISPSSEATWGEDRLGHDVVTPGNSFVFTLPLGTYDLKAEDGDHNVLDTRWSVNLSGSYSWNIGP
jgi:hypothetical protein